MKNLIRFGFVAVIFTCLLQCFSCKKDALTKYDTAVDKIKIYDDDSIALPITVTAGNNCLLSAYNTISGQLKFNLTDNNGKLIWNKQFNVKNISALLKENDGTFTIISGSRLINIDVNGTVLKDQPDAFPGLYSGSMIFHASINKINNYILTGSFNFTQPFTSVKAFAAEYTHDGTQVFQKSYIDTNWIPNVIVMGNYSAITGCELMDDGGYMFYGNFYVSMFHDWNNEIRHIIIRTDKLGNDLWYKYDLLVDTVGQSVQFAAEPPFVGNPTILRDIYGYNFMAYSHELMRTADGNYLCFINLPNYSSHDQRARVYKIDPNGNTLDSAFLDFGKYNRFMGSGAYYYKYPTSNIKSYSCGNGVVRNPDNTFSICMQNGFFGSKGLTNSYPSESRTFVVRIDQDLNILDKHYFQNNYTDCFTSVCKSSDGRTVYFGLISSFANSYKPALIISNDN